jgi:hypothetical protein
VILADNEGMKQIILFFTCVSFSLSWAAQSAVSCKQLINFNENELKREHQIDLQEEGSGFQISLNGDNAFKDSFEPAQSAPEFKVPETCAYLFKGNKDPLSSGLGEIDNKKLLTLANKNCERLSDKLQDPQKAEKERNAAKNVLDSLKGNLDQLTNTNFNNSDKKAELEIKYRGDASEALKTWQAAQEKYEEAKELSKKTAEQLNQCRQNGLVAVVNNYLVPCKAFSAMASINNWQHDSVGAPAPAVSGQAQPQVASGGCVKRGSFTADYKSCKTISGLIGAVGFSEMGMGVYQKVDMMNHSEKLTDDLNKSKDDLQVKAIAAQKSSTEKQSSQKNEQAMFQSAKGMSLLGSIAGFVTPKNAAKHCQAQYQGCCDYAVKSQYTGLFFSNQQIKDQALAMGVKAMGQAAMDKLMADQLKKRAGMLGNLEKAVAENGSTDGFQDWQGNYCQTPQGQADAQCINRGNGSSVRPTMQGSSFEIGSLGGLGAGDTNALGGSNNAANGKKLAALDDIKKGLVDFDAADKDGGSIGGSAAGFKAQGPLAAVSGGSGVGGASSGGAGKSSGDPSASSGARSSADSGPSTNISRYGKGKGGSSWKRYDGAGRGGKDEEPANAFAGLFDQPAQEREVASSDEIIQPGSDLFQKISIRYEQVNDENRLLKQ